MGVHILGAQAEEAILHARRIAGARRAYGEASPVPQPAVAHLFDGVGSAAAEPLAGGQQSTLAGRSEQSSPVIGVSDLDQRQRSLAEGAPEEIRGPVLRDDVVDFRPRDRHRLSGEKRRSDRRLSVTGRRGQTDDRLALRRANRAAMIVRLRCDTTVHDAVAEIGAHLAGEIDGEGLGHRHHRGVAGDDRRIGYIFDWEQNEAGIAIDQIVETSCPHRHAGHHLMAVEALARAGDDATLHQVHQRLSDDVRGNPQIAAFAEKAQHLVRHAVQADLQRGAVGDDPRHIPGNLLGRRAQRVVEVLDHRVVHHHDVLEAIEQNLAVRAGPRHVRIDSAITVRAASTAARVTSTETPRLHIPTRFGGLTWPSATSKASLLLCSRRGTSASDMGT